MLKKAYAFKNPEVNPLIEQKIVNYVKMSVCKNQEEMLGDLSCNLGL